MRKVKVHAYGNDGLMPVNVEDCIHGNEGSCISSSGNSMCGGYGGHYMIKKSCARFNFGHPDPVFTFVYCGEDKPK